MAENKHPHATREYTGPTQYFHNFEHDPLGRTHCEGPPSNPYKIKHVNGKNVINKEYAKGHGERNKITAFRFTKKFGGGFLLASGEEVSDAEYTKWLNGKKKRKMSAKKIASYFQPER